MVYLRCTGWVRGTRRHTRALAGRICVPCRRAVSNGSLEFQHPHILLGDGRASDRHGIRISIVCRKVDHSGAPQTNTAGSSEFLSRICNASRPRMGTSDSPRRRSGIDAQLEGVRKFWPVCRGTCIEEAVYHTDKSELVNAARSVA